MADAPASGAGGRKVVKVQVLFFAQKTPCGPRTSRGFLIGSTSFGRRLPSYEEDNALERPICGGYNTLRLSGGYICARSQLRPPSFGALLPLL